MGRKSLGLILILLGVLFLLSNLGFFSGAIVLWIIGGSFLFFYYNSGKSNSNRNLGLLIPGMIIIAVGVYDFLNKTLGITAIEGVTFLIFLGIAFIGIYLIHTRHSENGGFGERNWPLFPALGLFAVSLLSLLEKHLESELIAQILGNMFPIVLIIVGIVIFVRAVSKK